MKKQEQFDQFMKNALYSEYKNTTIKEGLFIKIKDRIISNSEFRKDNVYFFIGEKSFFRNYNLKQLLIALSFVLVLLLSGIIISSPQVRAMAYKIFEFGEIRLNNSTKYFKVISDENGQKRLQISKAEYSKLFDEVSKNTKPKENGSDVSKESKTTVKTYYSIEKLLSNVNYRFQLPSYLPSDTKFVRFDYYKTNNKARDSHIIAAYSKFSLVINYKENFEFLNEVNKNNLNGVRYTFWEYPVKFQEDLNKINKYYQIKVGNTISWSKDGVSYLLLPPSIIRKDDKVISSKELIKIAESLVNLNSIPTKLITPENFTIEKDTTSKELFEKVGFKIEYPYELPYDYAFKSGSTYKGSFGTGLVLSYRNKTKIEVGKPVEVIDYWVSKKLNNVMPPYVKAKEIIRVGMKLKVFKINETNFKNVYVEWKIKGLEHRVNFVGNDETKAVEIALELVNVSKQGIN